MTTKTFTALIHAYNEEVRLPPLVNSLQSVAHVIILAAWNDTSADTFYENQSVTLIKRPKEFEKWPVPEQSRWSLGQAPTDYVLLAHCSMTFSRELLEIFSHEAAVKKANAIKHYNRYWSHGSEVYATGPFSKSTGCYFFDRRYVELSLATIHNEFPLKKDTIYRGLEASPRFSVNIFRDDSIETITQKHLRYAKREATENHALLHCNSAFQLIRKLVQAFLTSYLRLGAVWRGMPGLIWTLNDVCYRYYVEAIAWENRNGFSDVGMRTHHQTIKRKINPEVTNERSHECADSNNTNI